MRCFLTITLACILCNFKVAGQEFNKSINKDSLFKTILKEIPADRKKEFIENYNSGSEKSKEFLLMMFSMPRSSKKDLIQNVDRNYNEISLLKAEYAKLIPANYKVSIEFNPENNIISTKESIDLKIISYKNKETVVTQEWDLAYNSDKLNKMLAMLSWNNGTLKIIKALLTNAHCVSIENGVESTIGYARSGMGKYSYILFNSDLSAQQIKQYNDGCSYIYYKKNIVLEYLGGAVGPQCFPD